jgi:tetratricopeptide (TPR) repeat protein
MVMKPDATGERQKRAAAIAEALQRATIAIRNERPIDAKRIADEILKSQPGHPEATKIAGYALLMQDRAKEAVGPLEKAARGSHDPEIETQLAVALRQAGDSDKALIWLKRAIKRMPPFAAAFHELGYVLYSLERYDEAIATLQQGMAIAPMMTEMPVQLGHVFYANHDRTNAGNAFARALSINPNHADAIHGLGSIMMEVGDYAQAADLYRRAMAANPSDPLTRISLGNCLLELGEREIAYACFRAATAMGPQYYGKALKSLLGSGHGRFWLRPSGAAKFFKDEKI